MPHYGAYSKRNLATAHPDLQVVFNEVIKDFDNTIIHGHRSVEYQFEIYQMGRTLVDGVWVITDKSKVLTYLDGINKKSKHNYDPSMAIDAAPYPIDWANKDRAIFFVGFVLGTASRLLAEGKITHKVVSGMDWDNDTDLDDQTFIDRPHFQLIKP